MATEVVPIKFAVQSNPGRFGFDGDARLINCYVETGGEGSSTPLPVYAVDGLKTFASQTTSVGTRGLIYLEEKEAVYWVAGRLCYKVDTVGNVTLLGSLGGDGPVRMSRNASSPDPEIAIVASGSKFKIKDDVLTGIADPDLPAPVDVVYNGGRQIYAIADGRFFYTDLEEVDAVKELSFANAEAIPDGLVGLYSAGREVWFFGRESAEAWQVTASSTNPYQRIPGGVLTKGCLSTFSIARLDNSVAWLGNDGAVYHARGLAPQRISNRGVENAVKAEPAKNLINAISYLDAGHNMYVISGTNFTWVYDAQTKLWHERESKTMSRWRACGYAKLGDKHIVGDKDTGVLYELDRSTYDEAGEDLTMVIQSPAQQDHPHRLAWHQLFLDFTVGVGLNTTVSTEKDPQVMMRYRDSGAKDWSTEHTADLGVLGDTDERVMFNGLGASGYHGREYEVRLSAAVKRNFLRAHARVEQLKA